MCIKIINFNLFKQSLNIQRFGFSTRTSLIVHQLKIRFSRREWWSRSADDIPLW